MDSLLAGRARDERDIAAIDFPALLRPGDRIVCGQGPAEPLTLTRRLMAQAEALPPVEVFVGPLLSGTFTPETVRVTPLRFSSFGAMAGAARLWAAGLLDVVPSHYSAFDAAVGAGDWRADVVLLQLAPPRGGGGYSLGLINDYAGQAARHARLVIAEVNPDTPWTYDAALPEIIGTLVLVAAQHPPLDVPRSAMGATAQAIARQVAALVPDGATLQIGIGAIPDTVLSALSGHRELGIHSGVIGDGLVELISAGIVTNAAKGRDTGLTVTNAIYGGALARAHAHANPAVRVRPARDTHSHHVLGALNRLFAINSGLEVDLAGQVNAEMAGAAYVGGTGGLLDFARGAMASPGGRSIIALPSTARGGKVSRIVPRLSTVTVPKTDADMVVTEHGVADLRGATLKERVRRLIAIADPTFREDLERAACGDQGRGT